MPNGQPSMDTRGMRKALKISGVLLAAAMSSTLFAAENSQPNLSGQIQPSPRIIGGFQTSIDQVPATVALLKTSRVELDGDLFQAQFCGGTVIASRWILTAAHCVIDLQGIQTSPESLLVLTGSSDLDNPVNQPIPVVNIIAHPEYRSVERGRDIALLQLEYDSLVEPIAIDTLPVELDGTALIVGWGAVNSPQEDGRSQSFPKQLRGAIVNTTPGDECGRLYPDYNGYTDATTLCAGIPDGGRDSCQGDSGGPLYRINNAENRIAAVTGITSWGISCGVATNPGIYTNVSAYTAWIQGNIRSLAQTQPAPQPVNDDSPSTSISTTSPSTINTSPNNNAVASSVSNDDDDQFDNVFSGASWGSLLPLFALLIWRKGTNRAIRTSASEQSR